jgi:glutamate-1-semialdehyde 2,1-aminomutase
LISKLLKTNKSKELFNRAKESIVGGVASSLHKSEDEEYPIYIEWGKGSRLYDADGNEYIDYMGGFGPMILGYCPAAVGEAVVEQIAKGSQFAAPTETLNDVSKKLTEIIPCADRVSYQGTGTEANMLIFRMVRAYTGKDKIVKFEGHYHGWSDEELISFAPDSIKMMGPRIRPWKTLGSPGQLVRAAEDIIVLPWNDLEAIKRTLERQKHEIAAVITEPIMCNCEVVYPKPGFLEGLREVTAENDIILIFDEIITGLRLSLGGAQEYYGVTPDVCSFGKAVAGGFPLAGAAGKREMMEAGVHPVGTFNANPISIAACQATIKELEKPGVYDHMARLTRRLTEGINEIAKKTKITLYCSGTQSIWQIAFGISERMNDFRDNFRVNKRDYQIFRKGCLERGIRFHPSRGRFYTSAAHTDDDIDQTLVVVEEVLSKMSEG